ncbi:MAG TPA: hypothetical protein VKR23_02890 [Gaiellaceae bacterium]|nr:hypothetical protein [Gaiellaceae bacterium]
MLQLSDAKLELVELLPGNEVELLDEPSEEAERLLADSRPASAHARGELAEQLLDRFGDP